MELFKVANFYLEAFFILGFFYFYFFKDWLTSFYNLILLFYFVYTWKPLTFIDYELHFYFFFFYDLILIILVLFIGIFTWAITPALILIFLLFYLMAFLILFYFWGLVNYLAIFFDFAGLFTFTLPRIFYSEPILLIAFETDFF